jgi:transcriptional regulator with XRE-family HTH domain
MAKTISPLLPLTTELLHRFGERLRLARLRRRLTAKQVAERAGMAPMTLRSLERGGAGVTMGAYLAVLQVLGVEKDLDFLAAADSLGRELQDARLSVHSKVSVRAEPSAPSGWMERKRPAPEQLRKTPAALPEALQSKTSRRQAASTAQIKKQLKSGEDAGRWMEKSGYANSQALADLIDLTTSPPKRKRR